MINELGDDILTEILIRSFPDPRSACRRKTVCKHWRSLISDRGFNRRFLSYHQSMSMNMNTNTNTNTNTQPLPKLLLSCSGESLLLGFLPMPTDRRGRRLPCGFTVFDCFKDLLLCGFGEVGNAHTNAEFARSYFICNPFTRQWIALPLAPERPTGLKGLFARLVCEPLVPNSFDLGGGHEHRFRVVCIYEDDPKSIKLDVFCSDSGQWTKEALVLQGYCGLPRKDVVSCNGVLYVSYRRGEEVDAGLYLYTPLIAAINPFRLDMPPTPTDHSPISLSHKHLWNISVSQDALHMIVLQHAALSVWILNQDDGQSWSKVCEGPLKSSSTDGYHYLSFFSPTLHPQKPEVVFFTILACTAAKELGHFSSGLRRGGELEFVANQKQFFTGWKVFEPKVYCWPTPIPRYQKLRVGYDGSHRCWFQSDEPLTPSITTPT